MATALVDTYAAFPFTIAGGEGARVRDAAGRAYWDFYGGHAVALLGHSHPAITRAIASQAETLLFYSNAAPLEVRTRAAEALAAYAPEGLGRVFFCNSGAEANENSLKLAIQQTGRHAIAALQGAFHGRTFLALSATDNDRLRAPFRERLFPVRRLRPNVPEATAQIDDGVAAVIVEPIQSTAGVVELSAAFLQALRRRCDEVGALLIYDEVQTGFARLGRPFAAGAFGVMPDMLTLAKGIANGVPMGAVLMSPAVAARVRLNDLGTTFGGGPLACAALLAVLETVQTQRLADHAARFGDHARAVLRTGPVVEVRGRGCLLGLHLRGTARDLQAVLFERGFITGTSANPHVLRLLPPINMPLEALDALAAALAETEVPEHASLAETA